MKLFYLPSVFVFLVLTACSSPEENLAKANDFYFGKNGVTQDYDSALKYYTKAAKQGNPEAQNQLGKIYLKGHNMLPNPIAAGDWFQKAAEQNYAEAQNNLGQLYYKGLGYTQSYKQAFQWLDKAAEQGNTDAQFQLAIMYEFGQGIPEDFAKTTELLNKAIAQNHTEAKLWKDRLFIKVGSNGEILPDSAAEWFCVKDNRTGLLWESKQKKGLHNLTYKYTWSEAFAGKNNYVQQVNDAGLCGHQDWRGPTIDELITLIDTTQKPKINLAYFPYTINFYWSASENAVDESSAWYVNFITGSESTISKTVPTYVFLVHGGQPQKAEMGEKATQ